MGHDPTGSSSSSDSSVRVRVSVLVREGIAQDILFQTRLFDPSLCWFKDTILSRHVSRLSSWDSPHKTISPPPCRTEYPVRLPSTPDPQSTDVL
mmetsp:Transcript_27791/g.29935  ORF Transcript_27791/g.29935 Transcript_27791/m.29935 type:complete len:94 (-) Transcript_27791:210-491(-)